MEFYLTIGLNSKNLATALTQSVEVKSSARLAGNNVEKQVNAAMPHFPILLSE